jgi:iron complex transport system substrate-binding protein
MKITSRFILFAPIWIFIPISILALSCGKSSNSKKNTKADTTLCDSYKRNVTFVANPQRVISAAPGITEIIYALGEGRRLTGRTEYCDYPPEVNSIRTIGGLEDPDIETIATINPDLVIASTHFLKETVQELDALKIPTIIIRSQESFEGAYETIAAVAGIMNVKHRADSIIFKMKSEVDSISKLVSKKTIKPTVYYVIGFGKTGDYTAGGSTFISKLIEMAGGRNIASDVTGWSYSLEKLLENDPDIIVIRTGNKEIFCKSPSYNKLKAVKTGNVFEINDDLFEITGPRLAEGLKKLYNILHQKV